MGNRHIEIRIRIQIHIITFIVQFILFLANESEFCRNRKKTMYRHHFAVFLHSFVCHCGIDQGKNWWSQSSRTNDCIRKYISLSTLSFCLFNFAWHLRAHFSFFNPLFDSFLFCEQKERWKVAYCRCRRRWNKMKCNNSQRRERNKDGMKKEKEISWRNENIYC